MSGEFLPGSESLLLTLEGRLPVGTPRIQGAEFGFYPGMNETPSRFSNIPPGAYNNYMYMDPAHFHDNISLAQLNQSQSVLDIYADHRASRMELPLSRHPTGGADYPKKTSQSA